MTKFDARITKHYAYCPNCGREIRVNPNDHTEAGHAIRQGLFCPCRCNLRKSSKSL